MIPRILHQVHLGRKPLKNPALRVSFMQHNPEWTFILWDEEHISRHVDTLFLEIIMDNKIPYVAKSDMLRFIVCYEYGGVYSDTDMLCQKPLDSLLDHQNFCGEGWDGQMCNALIGCARGDGMFLETGIAVMEAIKTHGSALLNDIPKLCSVVFQAPYLKKCEKIYPLHYFNPFPWMDLTGRKKEWKDSYTVHQWYGMDEDGWTHKLF